MHNDRTLRLLLATLGIAALGGCRSAATPAPPAMTAANVQDGPVQLTADEGRIRDFVAAHHDEDITLLERAVNIPSGTLNAAGVRKVGELFADELRALGFTTRMTDMPASMRRGGHLIAEHPGTRGPRILLIGHLDTVFEGEGQRFSRSDSIARGAGTSDMKGGDVAMISALRALRATGGLDGARITVIMTGDEEAVGSPRELARRDLIELAQRADVALAFEGGSARRVSIARRGSSSWTLTSTARQAHSAGVFSSGGFGAIYEVSRILDTFRRELSGNPTLILDAFRRELSGDPTLTFNPGLIAGGTALQRDSSGTAVTVSGKTNIISPKATVNGDLRFLREVQKDSTRQRMREIVAQSLPGASSEITFRDGYPAMPPTAAGARLLSQFDAVSRSLGYGPVEGDPPESRGAGDISFVAAYTTGMDGLGVSGRGAHSPEESVNLNSLAMAAQRAAVLMRRLVENGQPRMIP